MGCGGLNFSFFLAAGLGEKGGSTDGGPGLAGRWAGAWRCTSRNPWPGGVIHSGALFSAEHYYAGRRHKPRTAPGYGLGTGLSTQFLWAEVRTDQVHTRSIT